MSGPKVMEIDYEALFRAREQNRGKWKSLLARYSAELEDLASQEEQMCELGLKTEEKPPSTEELRKRTESFFEEEDGREGVTEVTKALHAAQMHLAQMQSKIKSKATELQRRHVLLKGGLRKLQAETEGFRKQYAALIPGSFPGEAREGLRQGLQAKLDGLNAPACPDLELNVDGIASLKQTEAKLRELLGKFESIREWSFNELNDENARLLTESILENAEPVKSLSDWLTENRSEPEATEEKCDDVAEKLDQLLAELIVLKDYPYWETLYGKADAVREEKSSAKRRMLYEGLLIECSHKVKLAKKHEAWSKDMGELYAAAALLESTQGKEFAKELKAIERSGDTAIELQELRARMKAIRDEEESAGETEKRIKAVLESLKEQGYEMGKEIMEVATVKKGELVFEKPITLNLPGEEDYAVLVKVVGENRVQTEMVRYDDAEESANQRIRDKEKEETWCAHHALMRRDLEGLGYSINLKLKKNAGELPVRIVSRDKPKATRRRIAKSPAKRERTES